MRVRGILDGVRFIVKLELLENDCSGVIIIDSRSGRLSIANLLMVRKLLRGVTSFRFGKASANRSEESAWS